MTRIFLVGRAALTFALVVLVSVGSHTDAQQPSPPGQRGQPPVSGSEPTVFDANGKRVGNIIGISVNGPNVAMTVAMTVGGNLLVLGATLDRFLGAVDSALEFESIDCSGTTVFVSSSDIDRARAALPFPSAVVALSRVYLPDPSALPLEITVRSVVFTDSFFGSFSNGCEVRDPYVASVYPVTLAVDLNEHFTPPFTVR